MKPASKTVATIMATGATNGETLTAVVDTLGFDFAEVALVMGTANTVSNKPSTLKLSESDITDSTGYSDITAFVGGGAGGFTIPNANTAAENIYAFNVDTRNRKRYLKLTVSPRTTQAAVLVSRLSKGEVSPDFNATTAGVAALVKG